MAAYKNIKWILGLACRASIHAALGQSGVKHWNNCTTLFKCICSILTYLKIWEKMSDKYISGIHKLLKWTESYFYGEVR